LCKESIKKDNDEKPSHLEREIDLTNQKRNNFDEGIGKMRQEGQGCRLRSQHWLQLGITLPCEVLRTTDQCLGIK
jgi:hypothetical protein